MRFSLICIIALTALLLFWLNPHMSLLGMPAWLPLLLCVAIVALVRRRLPPPGVSH
ncbi:MAG TPA: hypothetical protein PK808_04425 [Polymorphobacter sp.]|jgi:hypothetical protein|nr:hypothetical protein [Polymorphobacter sp.]